MTIAGCLAQMSKHATRVLLNGCAARRWPFHFALQPCQENQSRFDSPFSNHGPQEEPWRSRQQDGPKLCCKVAGARVVRSRHSPAVEERRLQDGPRLPTLESYSPCKRTGGHSSSRDEGNGKACETTSSFRRSQRC